MAFESSSSPRPLLKRRSYKCIELTRNSIGKCGFNEKHRERLKGSLWGDDGDMISVPTRRNAGSHLDRNRTVPAWAPLHTISPFSFTRMSSIRDSASSLALVPPDLGLPLGGQDMISLIAIYWELAGRLRGPMFWANCVSTTPVMTVRTLMPSGASSRRIVSEILVKAALEEQYAPRSHHTC